MSEPASQITEYFLGIEGEQKGPFSQEEVSAMLIRGEISKDTPLWCAGMSDWIPIGEIERFKIEVEPAVSKIEELQPIQPLEPKQQKKLRTKLTEPLANPSAPSEQASFEPAFSDSVTFKASDSDKKLGNQNFLIGALSLVVVVAIAVYFNFGQKQNSKQETREGAKVSPSQQRAMKLSKLQTEFNKSPTSAITELTSMVKDNPSDNVGLEALETLLSYYRRQQMFSEAGSLLMVAKKPNEALEYFLKDPPNYSKAAEAYEESYKQAKPTERREFLVKEIELLIGRLGNIDKAIERIKVLDKEFPGVPHPFQYYLKTTEQRLSDMFSRVSFYYLELFNSYVLGELSQISFGGKPLIQLTKDKNDKYRIVATQKGGISLRNDPIPNAYFVFWLVNGQWVIVDTNLTKERAAFAVEERKKYEKEVIPPGEMLQNLETVFRTQFPGKGLHELVTPPKRLPLGQAE